jgi:small subunit ribosomal protein S3
MGQKTHPLGFRLGITKEHKSTWYSNLNQYANILKEDDHIRTYLDKISRKYSIANVKINRNGINDHSELIIETGEPAVLVGDIGSKLKNLLNNIKKLVDSNRQITIKVFEIKEENIDLNASLLADSVVENLEKRLPFRKAIMKGLEKAKAKNAKGIKIQVSGRLNGAEIARSEWIRDGRVPLQTLRANIDYATKEANTIYGVLGIKVWLFKNEIVSK